MVTGGVGGIALAAFTAHHESSGCGEVEQPIINIAVIRVPGSTPEKMCRKIP